MSLIELTLIAVGLAMDAFAVSITKGLSLQKIDYKKALITGLFFGGFQFLMPVIGFYLGYNFKDYISEMDHWIAFVLLAGIGISMIRESRKEAEGDSDFSLKTMTVLAIATSIDALTVGISFALLGVNIWTSSLLIGVITFCLSFIGVKVGFAFGTRFKSKAEVLGGVILILIGTKILLEHLGIL